MCSFSTSCSARAVPRSGAAGVAGFPMGRRLGARAWEPAGGSPNVVVAVPETGFRYTKGAPKPFKRADLPSPVTREFCAECGTHMVSRAPALAGAAIIKLGTLDKPSAFGNPQMAIFLVDKQPFHTLPAGIATFERMPG